jgi:hypothetical protein
MASVGRLVAGLLVVAAAVGPSARFSSAETLDPAYDQGLARARTGWVVSGTDVLARLDEHLQTVQRLDGAIPAEWTQRGFTHIGDVDVAGTTLYVPFEQPDYEQGHQAMARYDADTLTFRDATIVDQHENSFVTVDAASGIAYSMDRFDGNALLRYDVRAGWRPLTPLRLDQQLTRVQGAAVARDAVWLSTDDDHQGLYRVDIDSGVVDRLGSAPPDGGEGEGIDAATISAGNLHVTVVNADRAAVTLDHFRTRGEPSADAPVAAKTDTSWPPALTYFAIALGLAAIGAVLTVFYRARTTLRPKR